MFSPLCLQGIESAFDLGCVMLSPGSAEPVIPYVTSANGNCVFNAIGTASLSTCNAKQVGARRMCPCTCPANHFGSGLACTPCPSGSIAPAGSRFPSDCVCSPLHYVRVDGSCARCPSPPNSTVAPFNVSDEFLRAGGDVAAWQGASSVTKCGHFGTVLGGYNQLGRSSFLRKTFKGLCTHNSIALAFGFIAIDAWAGETALLFVDDVLVWSKSFSNINVGDGGCGGPAGDSLEIKGNLVVLHSERQIKVEFRTSLDNARGPVEASWGLSFFAAGALCSGKDVSECVPGLPSPGSFGGAVDGELALVGDTGLVTSVFSNLVKRTLGASMWLLQNVGGVVDMATMQNWTVSGMDRWVVGTRTQNNQNCHTTCSSAGLSCSNAAFPFHALNNANLVRGLFQAVAIPCSWMSFDPWSGNANPRFSENLDSEGKPYQPRSGGCYYGFRESASAAGQRVIPDCDTWSYVPRLCPCGTY